MGHKQYLVAPGASYIEKSFQTLTTIKWLQGFLGSDRTRHQRFQAEFPENFSGFQYDSFFHILSSINVLGPGQSAIPVPDVSSLGTIHYVVN
jgi:hypothetical protein